MIVLEFSLNQMVFHRPTNDLFKYAPFNLENLDLFTTRVWIYIYNLTRKSGKVLIFKYLKDSTIP